MSSAAAPTDGAVPGVGPSTAAETAGPAIAAPPAGPSYEVFEFFAGLGGFCLSLPPSLPVHSITAVEIDQRAALTYKYNLHAHKGDAAKERSEKSGDAGGSAAASASTGTQSVRSRIKENRKIFFQQQKEKLAQQQLAAQAQSSGAGEGAVDAPAVAAPASAVGAVPAPAAAEPEAASTPTPAATSSSSSAGAPTRLLVASTTMSAFDLPAPDFSARASSVVQSATPPRLLLRLIEQLPPSSLASSAPEIRPSIWCMSPPCQPFTRTKCSKQLDSSDPRSAALLFLLRTLRSLAPNQRPRFIFMENVKHFHGSGAHALWVETLRHCGYDFTQYLLSPMQVGVPNHRTRYYTAARRVDLPETLCPRRVAAMAELVLLPPGCEATGLSVAEAQGAELGEQEEEEEEESETVTEGESAADAATAAAPTAAVVASDAAAASPALPAVLPKSSSLPCCTPPAALHSFLNPSLPAEALAALQVPAGVLSRGFHLSVVSPWDRGTFCFTGGYGKVINVSSGSFLLHRGAAVDAGQALAAHPLDKSQGLAPYAGCVRFFSPMELLRMFGFPDWYRFPPHFTIVHAYKLVGNSVNIGVVRLILQHHLAHCLPQAQVQPQAK